MTDLTREEVQVYNLMLRELHGDFGPELRRAVGERSIEVFDAIWTRLRGGAAASPAATQLVADSIDWTVIRILAAAIESNITSEVFEKWTGRQLAAVKSLAEKARAEIRTMSREAGFVVYQRGDCLMRLPTLSLSGKGTVVAVPNESNWDRLMPECARGCRTEIVEELASYHRRRGNWEWISRDEGTWEDLVAWTRGDQARSYLGSEAS